MMQDDQKYDFSLSVLLPAYNEEENLTRNLPKMIGALDQYISDLEVIIIDDGSTDGTARVAEEFAARDPRIRLIRHEKNMGPCSGIITAAPLATRDLLIFLPADIAVRLDQLPRYFDAMRNADIVVGVSSARSDYTAVRKLSSFVYIQFIKLLFRLPQRQFNYVHLYRREVFQKCPPSVCGVFMSVEILVNARDAGFRISEVDIEYVPREFGVASCGKPTVILDTIRDALCFYFKRRRTRTAVR
jgi:glycosyltransferase involved in cell wall biosynthesis